MSSVKPPRSIRRVLTDAVPSSRAVSMPVTRSDEYYIPEGDTVLQVEDTVFRLHRYILRTHSGFFREMLSAPENNSEEGSTDGKSFRLPKEVCSAQSFTTLCKFIYPRHFGVFPEILVKDLDIWETVIQATQALQMTDIQHYILSRLEEDKEDFAKEAVRLLGLATSASHQGLEFECLRTLVYRRRPISPAEAYLMGGQAMAHIAFIRERIRIVLLSESTRSSLRSSVLLHNSCGKRQSCQKIIVDRILQRLKAKPIVDPRHNDYNHDIFQISSDDEYYRDLDLDDVIEPSWAMSSGPPVIAPRRTGLCTYCDETMDKLAASLKEAELDKVIRECMKSLASDSSNANNSC